MRRLACLALIVLAAGTLPAFAHGQSMSYSTWVISDNVVTMRFLLPRTEAERLMGAGVPVLTVKRLSEYLLKQVSVRDVRGPCAPMDQGYDLGLVDPLEVGAELYGFEIFFRCTEPHGIVLQVSALFAQAPHHLHLARLYKNGRAGEHFFTADDREWRVPDAAAPPQPRFGEYLALGARHVLENADRLCLVLGLLLLVRRPRELGYVALALILGYGFSLGATGAVGFVPRAGLLEAFVGLLIATLGLAIVMKQVPRPGLIALAWATLLLLMALAAALTHAGTAAWVALGGALLSWGVLASLATSSADRRLWWMFLAVLLGFVDGFAWSAALQPAELDASERTSMILRLDLGAVFIELALLGLVGGLLLFLRSRRQVSAAPLLREVCAAGLAGIGTFWLVSRLWG